MKPRIVRLAATSRSSPAPNDPPPTTVIFGTNGMLTAFTSFRAAANDFRFVSASRPTLKPVTSWKKTMGKFV